MERPPKYSIDFASEILPGNKGFLIYNDFRLPMDLGEGNGWAVLPKKAASLLIQDINEILLKDTFLDEGDPKKAYSFSEVTKHPKCASIRKNQQNQSFIIQVYQLEKELERKKGVFHLELNSLIQWDWLFRLSPDPKVKTDQMNAATEAINWFDSDWVDLPANYATSLEEMEELEVPLVDVNLIQKLEAELAEMSISEKLAVWRLYQFFHRFSITLPILWVRGRIKSSTLENSYYSLTSDFSLKEIRAIRKEDGNFVQKRLGFLRKYLKATSSSSLKK